MLGLILAIGVLVALAPLFLDSYATLIFFQIFQLLALSQAWNLLAGYGGLVSLAPAASVGLGGYAAAIVGIHMGLPIPLLMVLGGLLAAVFALLVSVPMFRFRGLYFTIATLVLAEALRLFMINWGLLGGAKGLFLAKYAPSEDTLYYYSLVLAILTIVVMFVVLRTRLGLSLRALRDDEDTAQEIGVSTFRTKLWVFVLTAFFMGLMGALQTVRLGVIEPYGAFSLNWTINTVITPIIGGLGTIVGPIVGAFFTVWLAEALSRFPEIHVAITGVIVIVMIRFAPMGIWGIVVNLWHKAIGGRRTTPNETDGASRLATGGSDLHRPRTRSADAAPENAALGIQSAKTLLRVRGVTKRWGDVVAIDGVDLELYDGEVLGIIGPNGAGKSTLVGTLSGALVADAGTIEFDDTDVTHAPAFKRARMGIGRTHQIPRPFAGMTVFENLLVARSYGGRKHSAGDIHADCQAILDEVGLRDAAHTPAGDLTLLQLKRLELARALALEPKILLMDEIGAGLVESELAELIMLIRHLRGKLRAIVIIEHIMDVIQKCCDRVAVLDWGKVVASGDVQQVLSSPEVISCYLGTGGGQAVTAAPAAAKRAESVTPLLLVENVSAGYGNFRALSNVSLSIKQGEVVALLGTNGSGKTTVARTISGIIPALSGTITFDGRLISGQPAHVVTRHGLAHCMEGRHIFADLTVEENLSLAAAVLKVKGTELQERLGRVYDLFDVLAERRRKSGRELSGGQQQMLAIGRALMANPRLIIFDEITLGLAPTTVDHLYETLTTIRDQGTTMLIIEQNVERGLALADRVYVMEKGTVALSGTPAELRGNPRLESLYMGEAC
jgi:ABC-type branched-subunit amino acid transport system ATPase component/ABC-type branched-subunit amino acid transport system permease subunit